MRSDAQGSGKAESGGERKQCAIRAEFLFLGLFSVFIFLLPPFCGNRSQKQQKPSAVHKRSPARNGKWENLKKSGGAIEDRMCGNSPFSPAKGRPWGGKIAERKDASQLAGRRENWGSRNFGVNCKRLRRGEALLVEKKKRESVRE